MAVRGSRREKSVYTFGLAGRVLWTLGSLTVLYFMLSPMVRILRGGLINAGTSVIVPIFFAVGGMILLFWVLPRFMRDVWQPASIAGDEQSELRDRLRRESESQESTPPQSDTELLSQRSAPTRW